MWRARRSHDERPLHRARAARRSPGALLSADDLRVLAEEQAALRRVATLVARGAGQRGQARALPAGDPVTSRAPGP